MEQNSVMGNLSETEEKPETAVESEVASNTDAILSESETAVNADAETAATDAGAVEIPLDTEKSAVDKNAGGIKGFFVRLGNTKFCMFWINLWKKFKAKHPNIAQFLVFFMLSNGVTVFQLLFMPLLKFIFSFTPLINTNFQLLRVGTFDGKPYYIFGFAAGKIGETVNGTVGQGGLAFFLATYITIGIAQVINFFAQRNITFKSNTNPWIAAMWYLIAFILITIGSSALLGFYRDFLFDLMSGMGGFGEFLADIVVMFINTTISFWVFFPIFKVIFKQKPEKKKPEENKN